METKSKAFIKKEYLGILLHDSYVERSVLKREEKRVMPHFVLGNGEARAKWLASKTNGITAEIDNTSNDDIEDDEFDDIIDEDME